jgi:hypothetical protein
MDILSMADNVVRQIVMHSSVYMMILAVKWYRLIIIYFGHTFLCVISTVQIATTLNLLNVIFTKDVLTVTKC